MQQHAGVAKTVEVPCKKGEKSDVAQLLALSLFVKRVKKCSTWAVPTAEEERTVKGRYWLARIVDLPYRNPQKFMYRGGRLEKDYCITKLQWLRCVRRSVVWSYKEKSAVSYLSMNAIIRTDGPVVLTKPRGRAKKGEVDLSSKEQTRIFNAALLNFFVLYFL